MKRDNKYFAKRTPCKQGCIHGSAKEAKRCDVLHQREAAGEIEDLELQPKFFFEVDGKPLKHANGHRVGYTADFRYTDRREAVRVVEEVKGYSVRDWPLRKAIFKALNPHLLLREV
jgi:hypothetical protein